MHILIVGGTGSVGQALIRQLQSRRPKAHLTVVSRTATALPGGARVLTGHFADLLAHAAGHRLLAGVDAVVHLGDGLSILQHARHVADPALARRLIAASDALAAAVREARVPLLVHVSSVKALCDEADDRVLVETSPSRATTLYGRSKLQLEERLAAVLGQSDTRLAIVRNPVTYGGAKAGSMSRLLRLVDSPLPLPLAGLANRRSLLATDNLASALAAILEAGGLPKAGPGAASRAAYGATPGAAPGGEPGTSPGVLPAVVDEAAPGCRGTCGVLHVHDGPALSTTQIVETLRLALGRRRRLFGAGARLGHVVAGIAGGTPAIGPAVRRLYGSLELSDARFRQAFKWSPVIDTREALTRMAMAAIGQG